MKTRCRTAEARGSSLDSSDKETVSTNVICCSKASEPDIGGRRLSVGTRHSGVGARHICVGARRTCVGAQLSELEEAETELSGPDGVYNADLGRIGVFGEKELEDQCLMGRWSSAIKAVTCAWPLAQGGHLKECPNWFIDVCSMLSNEESTSMQSECVINININLVVCKNIYSRYSVYRNLRFMLFDLWKTIYMKVFQRNQDAAYIQFSCNFSFIYNHLCARKNKLYRFKIIYNTNKTSLFRDNKTLKCALLKMIKLKSSVGPRRTVIGP